VSSIPDAVASGYFYYSGFEVVAEEIAQPEVLVGAAESVNAGRPSGSNLGNAALASLSIGDYTSQCTPSGRRDGMQSRQR
jgi:hypothetical protein